MPAIRTSRKSGFITRGGRQRCETVWLNFPFAQNTEAASATASFVYALNAAALELRPFTVVRTLFDWLCISDQSAATEVAIGNFGLCVVSDQASAIGVTAIPTPATDQSSDLWFLIQPWIVQSQLIGSDWGTNLVPRSIESRAMRKVDIGQDVVGATEAGIGGSGVTIYTVGRMLIKLR